jgi:hypothetical protein
LRRQALTEDPAGVALTVFAATPFDRAEAAGTGLAVRRWLGLDDDLTGFHAVAEADPAMAPVLGAAARGRGDPRRRPGTGRLSPANQPGPANRASLASAA